MNVRNDSGTFRFVHESIIAASPADVFHFHERPEALRLLTPWWSGARIMSPPRDLRTGSIAVIHLGFGRLTMEWIAEHTVYEPPGLFVERQVFGPFAHWEHFHHFLSDRAGARLRDEIYYRPPLGLLGRLANPFVIQPFLRALFRYRHARTRQALAGAPTPTTT
ncbi:MAG TPA: SRPBCC family protein [Chloroflexota bacterium]|nr:SRPBCC family protein [Chloroflexota bacterium]